MDLTFNAVLGFRHPIFGNLRTEACQSSMPDVFVSS